MSDIMDYLFGPLGKDWCIYFYVFSIINFLLIFINGFLLINYAMSKFVNYYMIGLKGFLVIMNITFYIQFRILQGMCIKSNK